MLHQRAESCNGTQAHARVLVLQHGHDGIDERRCYCCELGLLACGHQALYAPQGGPLGFVKRVLGAPCEERRHIIHVLACLVGVLAEYGLAHETRQAMAELFAAFKHRRPAHTQALLQGDNHRRQKVSYAG